MVTGSTPEVSQDPSSETEMVNYSSGEDEPGTVHSDVALYNNPRTCICMVAETKIFSAYTSINHALRKVLMKCPIKEAIVQL